MKKSLWKRVLALVLCLALSAGYLPVPSFAEEAQEPVAFQQEEPVEEPEEEAQETQAPTTEPTTEPTEESTAATEETAEPAEGSTEPPQEEPDLDQAVSTLQALIDALPENVTEDNAEIVAAQLETVFDGLETLTEDQLAQLDLTRYRSALAALDALTGGLQEADTLDGDSEVEVRRGDDSQKYDTLEAAIAAINTLPSGLNFTVVLLSDVTLEDTLNINRCTITLDTNRKHITGTLNIGDQGSLTLTGEGTVDEIQIESANYNSAELKVTGGKVGSLYYDGGYPISVKLSGGSYSKIGLGQYAGNKGMTVRELLDSNYAFQIDGSLYRWKMISSLSVEHSDYGISVVPCSHDYHFKSYLGEKPGICVYCAAQCQHPSHGTDGKCNTCGEDCSHSFDSKTGACTVCGKVCTHNWNDNRCTICQMDRVASVITNTTTAYYPTLQAACEAAANCTEAENAVVTILAKTGASGTLQVEGGVFTLDTGGFENTFSNLRVVGSTVTLTGGGKIVILNIDLCQNAESGKQSTLTVRDVNVPAVAGDGTLKLDGGTIGTVTVNGSVELTDGTIQILNFDKNTAFTMNGGTVEKLCVYDSEARLSGGAYQLIHCVPSGGATLRDLLKVGYAYQIGTDKQKLSALSEDEISCSGSDKITIVECTSHSWDSTTGACEYCKTGCQHPNGYSNETGRCGICGAECDHQWKESGLCTVCGYQAEAKFNGTFYATLADALQAFQEAEGYGDIVLLKDLDTTQIDDPNPEAGSYYTPTLDLNGHTVGTLVVNQHVWVENNAQGSVMISSIQISGESQIVVDSNVTVENVTLDYGCIINRGGTVRKVTVIKSLKETTLAGGPFDEVYIQSAAKLTKLNLSTFASGDCIQKNGTAVSAWEVLASEKQEDGSYVYSIGGPITVSEEHSCDLTTGNCPCGWAGVIKVGDKAYDSVQSALYDIPEGDTVTLLRDVTLGQLTIIWSNNTIDWNGHTWTVDHDLTFEGTAVLTDSKYGGGLKGDAVEIRENVKIIGGSYAKITDSTGGAFLPEGYCLQDGFSKRERDYIKQVGTFHDVTVEKCENHTYGSDGKCEYCLVSAVASVTDSNQKVRYYGTWEDAFLFSMDGETLTLLADWEDEVTVSVDGARTLDLGGHTLKSLKSTGSLTLTVQGEGSLECITLELGKTKLLGGPFRKVVLSNITDPKDIDVAKLTPEGIRFLHTANYKDVTADDFKAGTEGCTLTGPVEGHIVHAFDQDTGLCPCGEQAEAKVNGTVYKTFEEALEALNSNSFLYLLKDVDRSGKTLSITKVEAIYWNGYTLTVHELTIDAGMVRMEDKTGTGGVKGTVRMGGCYQLRIHNGTYSGLTVRNGCTIYGGTYGKLTVPQTCDSVTINGGTFSKMDLFGNNQIIIPPGKMFYTTTGQVWTEVLGGQVIQELTLKDHDPHTPDETTGKCICGLSFAASVTAGETTAYYGTLQAAITEAAKTSGSTVKLFTDGTNVSVSSGTATIDWNGYTVTQLTVTGGTLTLTGEGGVSGTGEKALDIQGGTVNIQSGSYNNVYVGESANVTIEGGSFTGKEGQKPIDAADMSKVRFAVGKAVYNRDYEKKWRSNLPFDANGYLTVKDCTEHYADSEPDTCVYCATKLDARLDGGSSSYFGTFAEALAKAREEEGSTLQLLRDVEMADSGEISASGNFTIDWNGYTVSGGTMKLENGSEITMKNGKESGGFRGQEIRLVGYGTLTIQGGSYAPILHPVGDGDVISPWSLTIQGGTFTGNETNPPLPRDYPITVDKGYVFYDQDNNVVLDWATQGFAAGSTVTLKYHENHDPDENGKCVCGYEGAAMVRVMDWGTDGGFTETCYATFKDALTAVEGASGQNITLTLWQDITLNGAVTVKTAYPLTIDWNGKTLTIDMGLYLSPNSTDVVTLKDSKGTGALHAVLMLSSKSHIVSGNYYGVNEQNDNVETKISGGTFHERGEGAARSAPITFNSKGTKITLTGDNAYHNADGEVIGQGDIKLQAVVTVGPHDHLPTDCPCGRSYAAAVTVNGKETIYSTLTEAFENVVSGCTLKLLSDGTLESDPDTWDFTLDLGGCTLITYTDEYSYDPAPGYGQTLTVQDSGGTGVLKTQEGISLENSGSVALEGGTVEGNIDGGTGYSSITITGGTVTGSVIPNIGSLTITGGAIGTLKQGYATTTRTLHGGTFGKLDGCDRYMLDEGWALYDESNKVVNIGGDNIQNVTIKAHTHDYTTGSCPCGGVTSGEGLDLLKPDDYETLRTLGYQVNGEEVQLESKTWNGKEYLSRYDGVSLKNAIIQTYTWDYNANNDAYPTGTTVYRVVENKNHVLELKEETALKDLLEYKGASIRCEGNPGVRIITGMTRANKAALTGAGLGGYKLLEYGTVIAWANEMNGDSSLVLGKSYSRFGYAYNQAQNKDKVFDFTETGILYTNVLVNFAMSRCGDSVILRSFAVLEKDGVRFTIYGGQVGRTISGIAQQVLDDSTVDLTETERAYVQSLVDAGKGDSNG